jgi:tetratricopeptide (TPR) repeat protein
MADNPRIEDLRRRVQKDPASIAFAQLAEEYRRAGQFQESVDACRAGLDLHPGYLSARVTLGRALIELGQLDDAQHELGLVLKTAPENLAAIRGTADIHHKRGNLPEALQFYQTALGLARNDPDLEQLVNDLTRQLKPGKGPQKEGLSLEQMHKELTARLAAPMLSRAAPKIAAAPVAAATPVAAAAPVPPKAEAASLEDAGPTPKAKRAYDPDETVIQKVPSFLRRQAPADPERDRALKTITALEQWLDAIHVACADRVS